MWKMRQSSKDSYSVLCLYIHYRMDEEGCLLILSVGSKADPEFKEILVSGLEFISITERRRRVVY